MTLEGAEGQPDIFRRIGIASSGMHSMNRVWRQIRLQLQTKLRLYQTCILSFSCTVRKPGRSCRNIYGSLRPSIYVASIIRGIRWYDFVRNTEVITTTNLPSLQDIITKRRNSLFGNVVRLDDHTPAHRALSQVAAVRTDSCLNSGWHQCPGCPRYS